MRKRVIVVVAIALLLLAVTGVVAAYDWWQFAGVWHSNDWYDGSAQELFAWEVDPMYCDQYQNSDGLPCFYAEYIDHGAAICGWNGGPDRPWAGRGFVHFNRTSGDYFSTIRGSCQSPGQPVMSFNTGWTLDFQDDILYQWNGDVWFRWRPAP